MARKPVTKKVEDLRLPYDPFPRGREQFYKDCELVMDVDHRHRCEVRHCLQLRAAMGREFVETYVAQVARKRGKDAADRLMRDTREQWTLNNRGLSNDWREPVKEAA